jgi:hypothetical protein
MDNGAKADLPETTGALAPRLDDAGMVAMHPRQGAAQPVAPMAAQQNCHEASLTLPGRAMPRRCSTSTLRLALRARVSRSNFSSRNNAAVDTTRIAMSRLDVRHRQDIQDVE